MNKSGNNSIVVVPGANSAFRPEDIEANRELIEQCEIMILQLEIPLDTVCYAAKLAKSLGKTVILDPAPVPEHFPEELYEYVDIVKPNETELGMLTRELQEAQKHLTEAAQVLKARGVKNVLVTLGCDGVHINPESWRRDSDSSMQGKGGRYDGSRRFLYSSVGCNAFEWGIT